LPELPRLPKVTIDSRSHSAVGGREVGFTKLQILAIPAILAIDEALRHGRRTLNTKDF
jgi:hypothetical protein